MNIKDAVTAALAILVSLEVIDIEQAHQALSKANEAWHGLQMDGVSIEYLVESLKNVGVTKP